MSGRTPGTPPHGPPTPRALGGKREVPKELSALAGSTLGGRYELIEAVAHGGMGVVYRANLLRKPCAIKVLRTERAGSADAIKRFEREARVASAIEHPNIVNVTDFGVTDDGDVYLVMEYLEGRDLHDAIALEGAMKPQRCVQIARQVAAALEAAHARGVVHRDLKSHNIFLVPGEDGEPTVKLLDFGISKLLEPFDDGSAASLTTEGVIMGTPHYLSPEQVRGQVDERSDIYSLGVVMYEMLTGDLPFRGETVMEVLMMHANEAPQPPSRCRPDLQIPPSLEAIVLRALEKAPEKRFASASEVRQALDAAERSGFLPAPAPQHRYRALLALGAALACAVGAFFVLRPSAVVAPAADAGLARQVSTKSKVAADAGGGARPSGGSGSGREPAAAGVGSAASVGTAVGVGSAPAPDSAASVVLRFRAKPSHAVIRVDGRVVGRGTASATLRRDAKVTVRVSARGYVTQRRRLRAREHRTYRVELRRAPSGAGTARGKTAPATKRPRPFGDFEDANPYSKRARPRR